MKLLKGGIKNMFNFKKISTILTSAVMLSSTIGFAAAASYPQPFVVGGLADGAIVYGVNAAITDASAAIDVGNKLSALSTSGAASTSSAVTGEAVPLFTGGTKLYVNDSLNTVKSVLTKSDLPTILAAGSFSGNVDASITQTIDLGRDPAITFKRQPTSSDNPNYALQLSTTQANYIYNATATFSKSINFSSSDSEGNAIKLFGMEFTIGSATDADTLVLLKSAKKVDLSTDSPTADVVVVGETFTVELVSASDTAATIKVTNSAGASESREVNEAASKKINGITIAVVNADETNLKLSASIIAGSDKVTLESGNAVKIGEDDKSIDGTLVRFGNGTESFPVGAMPKLTISVYASESDKDAIKAGYSFIDPVYGTFKIDFSGLNIDSNATTSRETFELTPQGDNKIDIKFKDHRGHEKTFQWSKDIVSVIPGSRSTAYLVGDDDNRNITVAELSNITDDGFVVVGNEDEGHLLKLANVKNSSDIGSSNTASDKAEFVDVFSGETYTTSWTSDGVGTMVVGGKTINVYLGGNANNASNEFQVWLDYPDSTAAGSIILFPTIQTSKGAKIAFYQPTQIQLTGYVGGNFSRGGADVNNITEIRIPDGDGYETASIVPDVDSTGRVSLATNSSFFNITRDGTTSQFNTTGDSATVATGVLWSVEGLTFNITNHNLTADNGYNKTTIYLVEPDGAGNINGSALIIWEEKDDNTRWNAQIILLDPGRTSSDPLQVDISLSGDTWSNASSSWRATKPGNSDITESADLWGTIVTYDAAGSAPSKASISYPDEQVYVQVYMAEVAASITPGQSGTKGGGQIMIVKDSEVSDVAGKNLFVVGGSCINQVAAKILESNVPLCGADFTTKTNVGPGQYIIKSVKSPYSDAKVALLVAGYEAQDTVNAVRRTMEGVTTDIGTEVIGPVVTGG